VLGRIVSNSQFNFQRLVKSRSRIGCIFILLPVIIIFKLNGQATYRYKNGDTFERQFWKLRYYDLSSLYFAERCCHCVYINLLGRIVK